MTLFKFSLLVFMFFSCSGNKIKKGDTLSKSEVSYIQSIGILNNDEHIIRFYSEYKFKVAGNFFTDKRVASYWLDEKDKSKNRIEYAYYSDINSINSVYKVGLTFSPYVKINRKNNTQFKVFADGNKEEVSTFFEELIKTWKKSIPSTN